MSPPGWQTSGVSDQAESASEATSLSRQNRLATAAIVFAVLCWPLGIVFGQLARRRARYMNGEGAGRAVVALIIGCCLGFTMFLLLIIHLAQGPATQV